MIASSGSRWSDGLRREGKTGRQTLRPTTCYEACSWVIGWGVRTDVTQVEVSIVVEAVQRGEVNISTVGLVHHLCVCIDHVSRSERNSGGTHLETEHTVEIANSTCDSFPHIQKRVLQEALYRYPVAYAELRCESVAGPKARPAMKASVITHSDDD